MFSLLVVSSLAFTPPVNCADCVEPPPGSTTTAVAPENYVPPPSARGPEYDLKVGRAGLGISIALLAMGQGLLIGGSVVVVRTTRSRGVDQIECDSGGGCATDLYDPRDERRTRAIIVTFFGAAGTLGGAIGTGVSASKIVSAKKRLTLEPTASGLLIRF